PYGSYLSHCDRPLDLSSFPTRRSSDLRRRLDVVGVDAAPVGSRAHFLQAVFDGAFREHGGLGGIVVLGGGAGVDLGDHARGDRGRAQERADAQDEDVDGAAATGARRRKWRMEDGGWIHGTWFTRFTP